MKESLKLKRLELDHRIDEFSPLKLDVKLLDVSHLWEIPHEELFPDEIKEKTKEEINYLKVLITEFVRSDYSPMFCNQSRRQFSFYRSLAKNLAKHENIIYALIFSNTKTHLSKLVHGFKIAQILVFLEHLKYGEIPHSISKLKKFDISYKIYAALKAGTWTQCNTWNKFLEGLYGEDWFGLVSFLQKFRFEELIKRLPYLDPHRRSELRYVSKNFSKEIKERNSKETIRNLYNACQLGFYEKDGIFSWENLIEYSSRLKISNG